MSSRKIILELLNGGSVFNCQWFSKTLVFVEFDGKLHPNNSIMLCDTCLSGLCLWKRSRLPPKAVQSILSLLLSHLIDQIALPDFYYGAMENWGLVTYRENKLLYSPLTSSSRNKQSTATIIAHELAHMVMMMMISFSYLMGVLQLSDWQMMMLRDVILSCSGLVTWWPCGGGMRCGSMRDLLLMCLIWQLTICSQLGAWWGLHFVLYIFNIFPYMQLSSFSCFLGNTFSNYFFLMVVQDVPVPLVHWC